MCGKGKRKLPATFIVVPPVINFIPLHITSLSGHQKEARFTAVNNENLRKTVELDSLPLRRRVRLSASCVQAWLPTAIQLTSNPGMAGNVGSTMRYHVVGCHRAGLLRRFKQPTKLGAKRSSSLSLTSSWAPLRRLSLQLHPLFPLQTALLKNVQGSVSL